MSRILIHSGAPWAPTGYGTQTALFARRFKAAGHEVAISATWGANGATLEWEDMIVYPSDDRWGNILVPDLYDKHEADLLITLLDVWVLEPQRFSTLNVGSWVPVDHVPLPPRVHRYFAESGAKPIAMSRFGEQMLKDKNVESLYVPHGIDTNVFRPLEADRAVLRSAFGIPESAFVVGMVANNHGHTPPRKAFFEAMMAFTMLLEKHDDAFLYLHTEITGTRSGNNAGLDLLGLAAFVGIPADRIGFAPQLQIELDFPAENMAALYNCMDVLLNPSMGEGFGIPIVEAQACGTPVITTNWTAMPELTGAGWVVHGQPYFDHDHGSCFMIPSIGLIGESLLEAYDGKAAEFRPEAREFALKYDADHVMETYWKPALEELTRPREVPPLPNRAMRRAATKKKAKVEA